MIPSPRLWLAIAGGVVLLGSLGGAYLKGRADGGAIVQGKYARATEKALAAMRRGAVAIDRVNGLYTGARTRQDTLNRSIRDDATRILPRPVYSAVCVDADGVGLLDRARAAANAELDPGQPAGAAP